MPLIGYSVIWRTNDLFIIRQLITKNIAKDDKRKFKISKVAKFGQILSHWRASSRFNILCFELFVPSQPLR